jgi:Fe-S oxidoreductase
MGGGLNVAFQDMQLKMSAARIKEAESVGADAVVTPCQTCYKGLVKGKNEISSDLQVLHLNELLARSVCPDVTAEKIMRAFEQLAV